MKAIIITSLVYVTLLGTHYFTVKQVGRQQALTEIATDSRFTVAELEYIDEIEERMMKMKIKRSFR